MRRTSEKEGAPLFLAKKHRARRFMEFALHFWGKCAKMNETAFWAVDRYMKERVCLHGEAVWSTGFG